MEEILMAIILIVVIICYTVYKIDCNHVNNPKNNYPTGRLSKHRRLGKNVPTRENATPPGSKTYDHKLPNEEKLQAMFGKDYRKDRK